MAQVLMTSTDSYIGSTLLSTLRTLLVEGQSYKVHELVVALKRAGGYPSDLPKDPLLSLFHQQFLLMHGLFRLQDEFLQTQQVLKIEPMDIVLEQSESKAHRAALGPVASLKQYYLNLDHLAEANSETVAELLAGFWQRFHHLDEKSEALAVLGLEESEANLAQIKQRYQQRVHQLHPDKGGDANAFQAVKRAYEVLKTCYS